VVGVFGGTLPTGLAGSAHLGGLRRLALFKNPFGHDSSKALLERFGAVVWW
jgi:hypothetical protein